MATWSGNAADPRLSLSPCGRGRGPLREQREGEGYRTAAAIGRNEPPHPPAARVPPSPARGEGVFRLRGLQNNRPHCRWTYSYSSGRLLMPRSGGAIQPAILPGSITFCISECTNALLPSLGIQLARDFSYSSLCIRFP